MNQKELKRLLEEASKPGCSGKRINEIHCLLDEACAALQSNGVFSSGDTAAGIMLVLDKLFVDTVDKRRALLPSLFPVFALICDDRDRGVYLADINWSLA